jgi:hypothetical protein
VSGASTSAAAHVGEGLDLGLHEELVHPAVAAGDDHHVVLADLDHGERVVDRGMHDVEGAGGEPVALAARILGQMQIDLQAAPLENPLGDAGVQRQGLGLRKGVDAQHRRLVRRRGRCGGERERGRNSGNERDQPPRHPNAACGEDANETTHEPLPARPGCRTIAIIAARPAPRPRPTDSNDDVDRRVGSAILPQARNPGET